MSGIEIWAGKSAGLDPRSHFWVSSGVALKRLCDGLDWREGSLHNHGLGFHVPCSACNDLFVADAVYGRQVFRIRSGLPCPHSSQSAPTMAKSGNGV